MNFLLFSIYNTILSKNAMRIFFTFSIMGSERASLSAIRCMCDKIYVHVVYVLFVHVPYNSKCATVDNVVSHLLCICKKVWNQVALTTDCIVYIASFTIQLEIHFVSSVSRHRTLSLFSRFKTVCTLTMDSLSIAFLFFKMKNRQLLLFFFHAFLWCWFQIFFFLSKKILVC